MWRKYTKRAQVCKVKGNNATIIEWVSYPHFFKSENMIVLYVGENSEIVNALEELVGPQFAGFKE